jgi:hypothetical protein
MLAPWQLSSPPSLQFESYYTLSNIDSATPGLNYPTGIAVDVYANLYIADTGNNRVVVANYNGYVGSTQHSTTDSQSLCRR